MFRVVDGGLVTPRYLSRSDGLVFLTPGWVVEAGYGRGEISTAHPESQ
jgi:hypothetical protein